VKNQERKRKTERKTKNERKAAWVFVSDEFEGTLGRIFFAQEALDAR
jgi:hypothetical protein